MEFGLDFNNMEAPTTTNVRFLLLRMSLMIVVATCKHGVKYIEMYLNSNYFCLRKHVKYKYKYKTNENVTKVSNTQS